MTNKQIRKHLLKRDNVIKVRIARDGDVSVYTTVSRGDGGSTPWWQLIGNMHDSQFAHYIGLTD